MSRMSQSMFYSLASNLLRSAGFLVEVISVLNVLLMKVFRFLEARII